MAFAPKLPPLRGPGDHLHAVARSIVVFDEYVRAFGGANENTLSADVSPSYLYVRQAAQKIYDFRADAKIVIILRNPVDSVLSMYAMMRRDGREPLKSVLKAFEASQDRIAAGWEWAWDYKGVFSFSPQIRRFKELFPNENLHIQRYELLQRSPSDFFLRLCQFLDVEPIEQTGKRVNRSPTRADMLSQTGVGRVLLRQARGIARWLPRKWAKSVKRAVFDKAAFRLTNRERLELVEFFRDDIKELERLLECNLEEWLTTANHQNA